MTQKLSVYLDHSASTPVDPRVMDVMLPYFTDVYGNASSSHRFGRKAEQAIEDAREKMAAILHCKPSEIVFTSGGSESDNMALRGAAWHLREHSGRTKLVTMPLEHSAVGKTVDQLHDVMAFEQAVVAVDRFGSVDSAAFQQICADGAGLASIMYANNEVGTIEPIADLARIAHAHGALFHTDAVQGAGQLSLDVQALDADMMSLSAHKFYGPKGVGALYIRDGVELVPTQSGGSHENGRRAGTHNTPLIVGMAYALELAYAEIETHNAHCQNLRDQLIEGVLSRVKNAQLTGHPEQRLPSHASFIFEGVDSNLLLMHLDVKGIAASGGSACKTGNPEPSNVLMALGYNEQEAIGGLRLTVGRQTTADDIEYTVNALQDVVERLYSLVRV